MSRAIKQLLGYRCPVECNASDEVLQNLEVDDSFRKPHNYQAALHKERRVSAMKAVEPEKSIPKPAAKPMAMPKHHEDFAKPVVVHGAGNIIFGRGVMGACSL